MWTSECRYCVDNSIRFFIVGKGSNCLFDDRGFDGAIMLNRIQFLERIHGGIYRVGSGYPFNKLGVQCSAEGFAGLEFACGIPGTIGGAVFMNAGAHGQVLPFYLDMTSLFEWRLKGISYNGRSLKKKTVFAVTIIRFTLAIHV